MSAAWDEATPPQGLTGEVHVWRLTLDVAESALPRLRDVLQIDERDRADGFVVDTHRRRWLASRAGLRTLLGAYLGVAPEHVRIDADKRGKPVLRGAGLSFSLAHSGDLALVAVAEGPRVGVDLERIRTAPLRERLAERCFASAERAELAALPPELRDEAFFACWTRKEAVLKATGEGIAESLGDCVVPLHPLRARHGERIGEVERHGVSWCVRELQPADGYRAAIAIERPGPERLRTLRLRPRRAVSRGRA